MSKMTLRAARINAGLDVKYVAGHLGVAVDTIYRFEVGKSSPRIELAIQMAELYGLTVDQIDFLSSAKL